MIPRSLFQSGQIFAQSLIVLQNHFACFGGLPHHGTEARPRHGRAAHFGGKRAPACVPSPYLASGPDRIGRLSSPRLRAHRQGFAAGCLSRFSRRNHALQSGFRTEPTGGRACVFLPFSLPWVWQRRSPAAPNRAMASPMPCKRRVAAPLPGPSLAPPSRMPRMKTWSRGPRLVRWPVARPAVLPGCRPATDLTAAAAARPVVTRKAIRAFRPGGLLSLQSRARRPACR